MQHIKTLIPLSEFVLQLESNKDLAISEKWNFTLNYLKFLQQPLTISMFIPTGHNGEVLEEPKNDDECSSFFEKQEYFGLMKKYEQAKERCLFEGISKAQMQWFLKTYSKVEDLCNIINTLTPINLTPTALKQIY